LIVDAAKKKKKESNFSNPLVKWTTINRISVNVNCSGRQDSADCKLDRVKKFTKRPGQAKKKYLSLQNVTNLFANISNMCDYFENALLELLEPPATALFVKSDFPRDEQFSVMWYPVVNDDKQLAMKLQTLRRRRGGAECI
jgi:hypothetical protein